MGFDSWCTWWVLSSTRETHLFALKVHLCLCRFPFTIRSNFAFWIFSVGLVIGFPFNPLENSDLELCVSDFSQVRGRGCPALPGGHLAGDLRVLQRAAGLPEPAELPGAPGASFRGQAKSTTGSQRSPRNKSTTGRPFFPGAGASFARSLARKLRSQEWICPDAKESKLRQPWFSRQEHEIERSNERVGSSMVADVVVENGRVVH